MSSRMVPALAGAVLLAAAGCGSEPPAPQRPTAQTTGQPASPSRGAPAAVTITVAVAGGKVRAPSRRVAVHRGRTVEIVVTSDTTDELHLHGYDRQLTLKPGIPGVLRFVADQPGIFEVELHRSGIRLFELRVN